MEGISQALADASDMLEAFASVGTTGFDVTWTNLEGEKQQFRRSVALETIQSKLPKALDHAERHRHNLIVRPNTGSPLIQLDDLDDEHLTRVGAAAFLTLATSPGNHQAWIALSRPADDDFGRRLRKGTGADPTASGATRIAGSLNYKTRHAPDFPRIAIGQVSRGRTIAASELDAMGLVAAPEVVHVPRRNGYGYARPRLRQWPDYGRCLENAPANHGGSGPDVSRADFTFAMIAADWGWSVEDVASRLCEASSKAHENGPRYAILTATKAANAAARRNGRSSQPGLVP